VPDAVRRALAGAAAAAGSRRAVLAFLITRFSLTGLLGFLPADGRGDLSDMALPAGRGHFPPPMVVWIGPRGVTAPFDLLCRRRWHGLVPATATFRHGYAPAKVRYVDRAVPCKQSGRSFRRGDQCRRSSRRRPTQEDRSPLHPPSHLGLSAEQRVPGPYGLPAPVPTPRWTEPGGLTIARRRAPSGPAYLPL
jgi:hypothetical protein